MRRSGIKRKTPLKRVRPVKQTINRAASEAWARGVRTKRCALCGANGVHGHHIITQQQLRIAAFSLRLDFERLRWDTRNRLALCPRHHAAHHARSHPVPWVVLEQHAPKVFQFAREIGLEWWLEAMYPPERLERAA